MTIKTSLLGSAALSVICALSMTGAADAAAKHRAAAGGPSLAEQVKQLQATVESLERTVQAQAAAQQQSQAATTAQLQDAQTRADAANAAAKATQARLDMQIQQIPSKVSGAVQTAVASQPKTTIDKMKYKGVTITPGGYLEAAGIYRSKNIESDMASSYAKIPFENAPLSKVQEFRESERQSRLSLLVQGDITSTMHAAMYGEFDFLGAAQTANSNESNSYTPRTRVVYGTIDWDDMGLHMLAGQNWSLATLNSKGITPRNEVPPPAIDAQYVPGFAWARQPQIRITKDFADKQGWIAVSLENPQTTFTGTSGSGLPAGVGVLDLSTGNGAINGAPAVTSAFSGFNSVNTSSLNKLPDLIGKFAFEPNIGGARPLHIEGFGIYRQFYDQVTITAANTLGLAPGVSEKTQTGGGWGGSVTATVVPKILDLQASFLTGKGIGRYGSAQLSDATLNFDGAVAPIKETMFLLGGTLHATPKVDIYLFGGQERESSQISTVGATNYGYGNLANTAFTSAGCTTVGGACPATVRSVAQITGGLWDKAYTGSYGQIRLGLQYSHTWLDAFSGGGYTPRTSADMVFTSFRYYPF
jgi:hypothetical protein